jgi:hypothetical protein
LVGNAGQEIVLIDDLVVALDVFEDVVSTTRLTREDDYLGTALLLGLVQQSQDESSVSLGQIVPEAPVLELTLVLFDPGREESCLAGRVETASRGWMELTTNPSQTRLSCIP